MLHSDSFNIASVLSPTASSAMPDLLSDRPPSPVAEFGMPADIGGAPLAPGCRTPCLRPCTQLCLLALHSAVGAQVLYSCTAGSDSIANCMSGSASPSSSGSICCGGTQQLCRSRM